MITIKDQQYPAGSSFVVIDTESHYFPLGAVVTYTGECDSLLESYVFRGSNPRDMEQYLSIDQVTPMEIVKMSKSQQKFQPLYAFQTAKGAPLSLVGKILADVYAKRGKPMIQLPKKYDYHGQPSFVAAAETMTDGQIRDVNGEVWQAEKRGAGYVATV